MKRLSFLLSLLLTYGAGRSATQTFKHTDLINLNEEVSAETDNTKTIQGVGVVPALSVEDGTQKAYYLRNVQYPNSYFGSAAGTGDVLGYLTDSITERTIKVAVESNGTNGYKLWKLNADDTRTTRKLQAYGANKLWITEKNDYYNDNYEWLIDPVTDGSTKFVLRSISYRSGNSGNDGGPRALYAPAATTTQATTAKTDILYTTWTANSASDEACQWEFIPANDAAEAAAALTLSVLVGDDKHGDLATFSASYPVAVPSGYKAYTATAQTSGSNTTVELTEITDSFIPRHTGVILKADERLTAEAELTMTPCLTYTNNAGSSALTPTNEATVDISTLTGNTYCLSAYKSVLPNAGELAFFKRTSGTIPAHRAYLSLPEEGTNAIAMSFGGTPTMIDRVVTGDTEDPVYDLSGRMLRRLPQSGVYIRNGKKFIVK